MIFLVFVGVSVLGLFVFVLCTKSHKSPKSRTYVTLYSQPSDDEYTNNE